MLISEIFKPENIKIKLLSNTKKELFEELTDFFIKDGKSANRDDIINRMWERENRVTTGIAPNIAIPHISLYGILRTTGVLGISQTGIEYDSLDGKPVHLVMFLVGVENNPEEHLAVLKSIAELLKNDRFYPDIVKCADPG